MPSRWKQNGIFNHLFKYYLTRIFLVVVNPEFPLN
jgi:hypothetical protein